MLLWAGMGRVTTCLYMTIYYPVGSVVSTVSHGLWYGCYGLVQLVSVGFIAVGIPLWHPVPPWLVAKEECRNQVALDLEYGPYQ